jgi:hypothetical protein
MLGTTILVTMMREAIRSSEMTALARATLHMTQCGSSKKIRRFGGTVRTRATRRHIPEDSGLRAYITSSCSHKLKFKV